MSEISEKIKETKTKNEEVIGVTQKEYGITCAEDEHPVIGTANLDTCVAVTIYNPSSHVAGIAHVDATTDIWSLGRMFQDVSAEYSEDKNILFGVFGGPEGSEQLVETVKKKLRQISVVPQTTETLTGESVAIDSRSGKILKDVKITNMGKGIKVRLMGVHTGLESVRAGGQNIPLRRSYDGRKK